MKKDTIETYCVMCCGDYAHIVNKEDELVCSVCDTPASSGILDRDEQIENLSYENKMMAEKLKALGFANEQINNICTGGEEKSPNQLTPYIKELEESEKTAFILNERLFSISKSLQENGYMINVTLIENIDIEMDSEDGGLCTGTASDAVYFMTNMEKR